jgi:hypothetical protein
MFQALDVVLNAAKELQDVVLSGAKDLLSRGSQASPSLRSGRQLELDLEQSAPRTAEELLARLRTLGLKRPMQLTLTRNRNVMVSFKGDQLRVHEGFLSASEQVHRAIVTFVDGRTKAVRRAAQKVIVTHPISVTPKPPRRERMHPDDEGYATKLAEWHQRYNARHFDGKLNAIPVRISRRMKSRLGHYSVALPNGEPAEIAISRRHLRRHGWEEALHTLLHEMVHQWQDETGRTIDHSRAFRVMARKVGIAPRARRQMGA